MKGEIRYTIGELDGCRLIRVDYPDVVDLSKLSLATAAYITFWEEDVPTVQLNDVTGVDVRSAFRWDVLQSLLARNATRKNYWGSAYWIGDNEGLREGLVRTHLAANRPVDCVFTTREESIEYLRRCIREHRAEDAEPAPEPDETA